MQLGSILVKKVDNKDCRETKLNDLEIKLYSKLINKKDGDDQDKNDEIAKDIFRQLYECNCDDMKK